MSDTEFSEYTLTIHVPASVGREIAEILFDDVSAEAHRSWQLIGDRDVDLTITEQNSVVP